MKIRNPTVLRGVAWAGAAVLRLWMRTVRFRCVSVGPDVDPTSPACRGHYVYAFWHEHMLLPATRFGREDIHVLISTHRDGQLITDVIRRFRFSVVRGSTTRDAVRAVRSMLKLGDRTHFAITPDGPRGPRRVAQPGVAYVAARSGLPVVPVGIAYDRCWRFGSWDRFAFPHPFARGRMLLGAPIPVPADVDATALAHHLALVQSAMDRLPPAAESWATAATPAPPNPV